MGSPSGTYAIVHQLVDSNLSLQKRRGIDGKSGDMMERRKSGSLWLYNYILSNYIERAFRLVAFPYSPVHSHI